MAEIFKLAMEPTNNYLEDENKKETQREWDEHLQSFVEDLYPVFASHGFTKAEAYLAYNLRGIFSDILDKRDEED